jgi:hypothetical protein
VLFNVESNRVQSYRYPHGKGKKGKVIPVQAVEALRVSVVNWGTVLQAERSRFRFPMKSLDFFQFF